MKDYKKITYNEFISSLSLQEREKFVRNLFLGFIFILAISFFAAFGMATIMMQLAFPK